MDVSDGYRIEQPDVLVPWHIKESVLLDLLPSRPTHVTNGYYTLPCVSLGGLHHNIGFHFEPRNGGRLREFELFRGSYPNLDQSFQEFERHLERTLGPPTTTDKGNAGFPHLTWRLGKVQVVHYVLDRFGPEEHVRFRG